MKIRKDILPDIIDKTIFFKRLTKQEKYFEVPSVLDTLQVIEEIKFKDEHQEDSEFSTDSTTRLQEIHLINQYYATNPYEPLGAQVHHQGKVFLSTQVNYKLLTDKDLPTDKNQYQENNSPVPVICVRDINNPCRKCLRTEPIRKSSTQLFEGWLSQVESYDHIEYYPREYGSILRKPRHKKNKLRIYNFGGNPFGLGTIYIPSSLKGEDAAQELERKSRLSTNSYLNNYWVGERTVQDIKQESSFEVVYSNCTPTIKGGSRWARVPDIIQDQQLKKGEIATRPYRTDKRSFITIRESNNKEDSEFTVNSKKLRSGNIYMY
jgi:hypothetical protein